MWGFPGNCTCLLSSEYAQARSGRVISDTPLIDHLVLREFVSGPPSYRFIYERVRDRNPSLRKGSWAVCGFRTEFFPPVKSPLLLQKRLEALTEIVIMSRSLKWKIDWQYPLKIRHPRNPLNRETQIPRYLAVQIQHTSNLKRKRICSLTMYIV